MRILAVIPAHNESAAIFSVTKEVAAKGLDVLVVDDGSSDATAALARDAGAVVISTGRKSGKGSALRKGFAYAVGSGYDGVIAMDGDGQHSPSDIQRFIACRQATGADLISGNRMGNPVGMPWLRLATNAFMSWLISMICAQRVPDTQCGFRFLTTDLLKKITLECSDFEIETEMLIKASKAGCRIASVPIETIYRNEKSKIQPFKDTLRFIRFILKESFKR